MLFTSDAIPGLADGTITLTFRTWDRPQAKVGGRYRTGGLLLEVTAVSQVSPNSITDRDARRAGRASSNALRQWLEALGHDGMVWRVEFRCLGEDDRIARRNDTRLDRSKIERLQARLNRLDGASSIGDWTEKTLQLIDTYPGVVSTRLAQRMKMERQAFKLNVRKLKELGLTESLEVGYRLSPLGEAFMRASRP
jgi:hypothetical protein